LAKGNGGMHKDTDVPHLWTLVNYQRDKNLIESRMNNEKLKEEGDNYLRGKNYEKAEKIYNEILNIEPNNERVLSNLSMIYLFQGKYDEVINICSKILMIFNKFKERIKIKNMNNLFEKKSY